MSACLHGRVWHGRGVRGVGVWGCGYTDRVLYAHGALRAHGAHQVERVERLAAREQLGGGLGEHERAGAPDAGGAVHHHRRVQHALLRPL